MAHISSFNFILCVWNGALQFLFMPVHIFGCLVVPLAFQVCALFGTRLPHGVEDSSVLHDAEQLVGGGHVVRYRPLAISEKGVGRPNFADHQVVQPQDLNWTLEF